MKIKYTSPGIKDHGKLTGLEDDDHTQYMKESVYDTDASDIVDKAESLEKASGTIDITINSVKVGEIDANGNLRIKGQFIEGQTF